MPRAPLTKAPRHRKAPTAAVVPSDRVFYSDEVVERVCLDVLDGLTLREIADLPGRPSTSTMMRWTQKHPEFLARLLDARRLMVLDYLPEIIKLGETREGDEVKLKERRVEIDTKKWALSKLYPAVFGESPGVAVQVNNHTTTNNDNRSLYRSIQP